MPILPDNFASMTQAQKDAYFGSYQPVSTAPAPTTQPKPTLSSINQTSGQIEQLYNQPTNSLQRLGVTPTTISSTTIAPPSMDLSKSLSTASYQPPYPVASLDSTPPSSELQLTEPERQESELRKRLASFNEQTLGESAFRAEQEKTLGLEELRKTQTDLTSRLKAIQNEALQIPLQLQQDATGRGITAGGLRPIETAALRNNAIQALSVSSMLEATRGNITLAQSLADRAVEQKFGPIKEQIKVAKENLDLIINSPEYSVADKNRAIKQKEAQEAKASAIAKQEASAKEISSTLNLAIKYGLQDTQLMQRISQARSPLEALQLAAPYLQDPKAKYELEEARLNNILKGEQIRTEQAQRSSILNKMNASSIKNLPKQEQQKAASGALDEKDRLITEALNSPGLDSRVGPNASARRRFAALDAFGAGQNFAATIQQLTSTETLNKLIDAKANGATFGALSEGELNLLIASASKIGKWEVKDEKGVGTGEWNASEDDFKTELRHLQELTTKARQSIGSSVIDPDEKAQINEYVGGGQVVTADAVTIANNVWDDN